MVVGDGYMCRKEVAVSLCRCVIATLNAFSQQLIAILGSTLSLVYANLNVGWRTMPRSFLTGAADNSCPARLPTLGLCNCLDSKRLIQCILCPSYTEADNWTHPSLASTSASESMFSFTAIGWCCTVALSPEWRQR